MTGIIPADALALGIGAFFGELLANEGLSIWLQMIVGGKTKVFGFAISSVSDACFCFVPLSFRRSFSIPGRSYGSRFHCYRPQSVWKVYWLAYGGHQRRWQLFAWRNHCCTHHYQDQWGDVQFRQAMGTLSRPFSKSQAHDGSGVSSGCMRHKSSSLFGSAILSNPFIHTNARTMSLTFNSF